MTNTAILKIGRYSVFSLIRPDNDEMMKGQPMNAITQNWNQFYNQVPLCEVPGHFAAMRQSPFLMEYLSEVLTRCPRGGRSLETGIGSGFGPIWLSLRGVHAVGLDNSPFIVERAKQVNNTLGGGASFHVGDLFELDHWAIGDGDDPSGQLARDYQGAASSAPTAGDSAFAIRHSTFDVVHHQGVLEHFTVPQIRAAHTPSKPSK